MPLRLLTLVLFGAVLNTTRLDAQEPAVVPGADAQIEKGSKESSAGRLLFDGQSLTNWKTADFAGPGNVSVKDGSLVIEAGKPMSGIVWTGEALPKVNYEVTFEATRVEGSDFFVGLTFPVHDDPCTLIVGGWGGGLAGFSSIDGQDASENETTNFLKIENGRPYRVRLRVSEARMDAYLDDKRVSGCDYRGRKVGIRIEVEANRPFGFATYRTQAALKNIRLRELTPEEARQAVEDADRILREKES